MVIGCLGDIVFQVSEDIVETISEMEWSGSAQYAVHQRHAGNALTEFIGVDPDKVSFTMTLARELGVDVETEIEKFRSMEEKGEAVRLVIGTKSYGRYRWNLLKHSVKYRHHDRQGNPIVADVTVELQEYLKS